MKFTKLIRLVSAQHPYHAVIKMRREGKVSQTTSVVWNLTLAGLPNVVHPLDDAISDVTEGSI